MPQTDKHVPVDGLPCARLCNIACRHVRTKTSVLMAAKSNASSALPPLQALDWYSRLTLVRAQLTTCWRANFVGTLFGYVIATAASNAVIAELRMRYST